MIKRKRKDLKERLSSLLRILSLTYLRMQAILILRFWDWSHNRVEAKSLVEAKLTPSIPHPWTCILASYQIYLSPFVRLSSIRDVLTYANSCAPVSALKQARPP